MIDATAIKNGQLKAIFDWEMDENTPAATVQLRGKVAAVNRTTRVASRTSMVTSNAFVGSAQTPEFSINPNVDLDLDVTSSHDVTIEPHTDTAISGKVAVSTSATTQPIVKVRAMLNRQLLTTLTPDKDGGFNFAIAADQLRAGDNVLKVTATTAKGESSNTVVVKIKVQGVLKFDFISPREQFQASRLTGRDQVVQRSGDWQVVVQDTRGNDSQWTLMVHADRFRSRTGMPLMGGPIYVHDDGRTTDIHERPTPVVRHTTSEADKEGKYAVHKDWTKKTGVLLQVEAESAIGSYGGRITWTLADTPG
ncbi:hypothetical protein IV54_GL001067 [Levilactobacillus paucivorans]|uniref:WxL domain-containing protein n=2 Tax=Levilactobacillus paucivorans TaxID=616990 RepID=A0A0R2LGL7_9LACO|nr:hypothetical protein IV54_GL001067 [Levilactobacillus paucivorans]